LKFIEVDWGEDEEDPEIQVAFLMSALIGITQKLAELSIRVFGDR
jgi:hypothetical protein